MGIDSIAHQVALENKGKTIAVLAHGLSFMYPKKHINLRKEIVESGGLVLTEYKNDEPPKPYMFLQRSRIITGLAKSTLVVEAGSKSGSKTAGITAFNQFKTVYAIPGRLSDINSEGTNELIADLYAELATDPQKILKDLGLNYSIDSGDSNGLNEEEIKIIKLLKIGNVTANILSDKLNMLLSQVVTVLTKLELKNLIVRNLDFTYSCK